MSLNFSCLELKTNGGSWNQSVRCSAMLLDNKRPLASVKRDICNLLINIPQAEIEVLGKLPTSQNGGDGNILLNSAKVASFKCEKPSGRWLFFDVDGNETTSMEFATGWAEAGSFVQKFKRMLSEGIEITNQGQRFKSAKYLITCDPLLSPSEQKSFNENLSMINQVNVLTGIILIQTTFGLRFVT